MENEELVVQVDLSDLLEKIAARISDQDKRIAALEARQAQFEDVIRKQQAALQSMVRLVVLHEQSRQASSFVEANRRLVDLPASKYKI